MSSRIFLASPEAEENRTYAHTRGARVLPRPPRDVVISKKEIGDRLRGARRKRGVTQEKLASILGTNQSHVSNVERGDRGLTIQQLVKICRALRISPVEILGETKETKENGFIKDRRFIRRLQQVDRLSKADKLALLKTIDAYLKSSRG